MVDQSPSMKPIAILMLVSMPVLLGEGSASAAAASESMAKLMMV